MSSRESMRNRMSVKQKRGALAARLSRLWMAALVALVLCAAAPATQAHANPLDAIASFFGINAAEPAADGEQLNGAKTVDPESTTSWTGVIENSTENVGRIWTDKSVYDSNVKLQGGQNPEVEIGDSQFLVGLSALSSMSNTTTTTSAPLDIVLVLDTSGSMGTSTRNVYADELNTSYTYKYRDHIVGIPTERDVYWNEAENAWGFDNLLGRFEAVTPKASSGSAGEQLYVYSLVDLQRAAKEFVAKTLEANSAVSDDSKKHRIGIVSFASGAQTRADLTIVDNRTATQLSDTLDRLWANGATEADAGFDQAQDVLNGARDGAKKAVLFFTDGAPGQSGFDDTTANNAISIAHSMKEKETLIYSVGTFAGAEAGDTTGRENAFMNAVSSNYPDATSYTVLGGRVDSEKNYYFAAGEDQGLSGIFTEIFESMSSNTGLPTQVGGTKPADQDGYITITDQLDDYMKVDGFKSIVFADQQFKNVEKKSNGNVDAYTFSGTFDGNALYPEANLNKIGITVTHSENVSTGDLVEVKIPAALIPLRNFQVFPDEDGKSTVTNTYPLRIYFGVSLKSEVAGLLDNPDVDMQSYIKAHTSADGDKVMFYTNDWTNGNPGNTIANFTPATTNSYYYFTEATHFYTDEACSQHAQLPLDPSSRYFYQREYYEVVTEGANAGNVETKEATYSFLGSSAVAVQGDIRQDAQGAYFAAGTPRLTYIEELGLTKAEHNPAAGNLTGTGTDVINPVWDASQTQINVRLGNNGRLDVELPGALAVNKTLEVPEGYNIDDFKDVEFAFDIELKDANGDPIAGEIAAALKNAEGEITDKSMTFGDNGKPTDQVKLKNGETLYLYGLPKDATAKVTETIEPDSGYTANQTDITSTIAAGEVAQANFVNTYKPDDITVKTSEIFTVTKKLEGRDWNDTDQFEFRLRNEDGSPMPENAVQGEEFEVASAIATKDAQSVDFGSLTFDAPGEYKYYVRELPPNDRIPGISYTNVRYEFIVTVADDDRDGEISKDEVTVQVFKAADENGDSLGTPEFISGNTATFTNTYNSEFVNAGPMGVKLLKDADGNNMRVEADQFTFRVTAQQDNTPALGPNNQGKTLDKDEYVDVSSQNMGGINFGRARFDVNNIIGTDGYKYTVEEIIPGDAVNASGDRYADAAAGTVGPWIYQGVTYDDAVWTVHVYAKQNAGEIDLVWSYESSKNPGATPQQVQFVNTYSPSSVTLADDNLIKGSKTLEGRDFKDNETFGFMISAVNDAATNGLADKTITGLKGLTVDDAVVASKGNTGFNFGSATFTKAGVYKFRVAEMLWNGEQLPAQKTEGVEFDESTYEVTVTVTDKGGKLEAETSYVKSDGSPAGEAAFTNVYTASGSYGDIDATGLTVSKTLNGRSMAAGEFDFVISAAEGEDNYDDAKAKLEALDKSAYKFSNGQRGAGLEWSTLALKGMTFTNDDAGKTFVYLVDEVEPEGDDAKGGVTYDKSQYRVEIAITDNDDGTLDANTTITQVKNAAGEDAATPSVVDKAAFVNTYKAGEVTESFDTQLSTRLYKVLTGRDWKNSDKFEFMVEPQDGAPKPSGVSAEGTVTIQGDDKWDSSHMAPIALGDITFTEAGTYVYHVTEVEPADGTKISGITYDTHTAVVTINVVDNGDGTLTASLRTVTSGRFENMYGAKVNFANAVDFKLSKKLVGHDMTAEQFTFLLSANKAGAKKLGLPEDGSAIEFHGPSQKAIDEMNVAGSDTANMPSAVDVPLEFFTKDSGTEFVYKFAEKDLSEEQGYTGYTFDNTKYELSITPTDNGDGTMTIETTLKTIKGDQETTVTKNTKDDGKYDVHLPFVNEYKPLGFEGVPANFTLRKVLDGKKWGAKDSFSFVLKSENGAPMPADAAEDGTKTVAVSAKTGIDSTTGNDYADFNFGEIVYDKATPADQPWVYTVTEVDGRHDGYTYSKNTARIEVRVTDNAGQLSAVATVQNSTFTNVYKAELDYGKGGLAITKTLNGRNLMADQFEFTVTAKDDASGALLGAGAVDNRLVIDKHPGGEIGTAVEVGKLFENLKFTQDMLGTYEYTIAETSTLGTGYTCANDSFNVSIDVVDKGDGDLAATTTVLDKAGTKVGEYVYQTGVDPTELATVDFVNTYDATETGIGGDGQVRLNATKTLTGRDMTAGEFGFTAYNVTNASGEPIQVATGSNAAALNGQPGAVTFGAIEFSSESLAKDANAGNAIAQTDTATGAITYTYNYRIEETSGFGGDTGVEQGAKSFDLTVTVVDDNERKLTATVSGYPQNSNDTLSFTNFYGQAAQATVQVNGVKNYNRPSGEGYKVPDIEGKFSFTLEGKDGAPMPAGATGNTLTVNNTAGNVNFGSITYTMESVWGTPVVTTDASGEEGIETAASQPKEKVFTYVVTESGSVDGVANDPNAVRKFTVTVKDDGKGNITAEPSFGTDRAFTFTNSYTVNPGGGSLTGDGGFKISKQLKGRTLAEGEFEFALTDAAGNVVASAKNAADGTVTMPNVTFDNPGVYKYKLSEVAGKLGGVTYDTTVYDVTATVEHPGEDANALTVEWAVDGHKAGDELTFVNTYEAAPTSIVFKAAKVLKGRDLKDGEFEFTLSENGKVLQTVKNDANGQIAFEWIKYTEPGEHEYVIAEVKGDVKGVTYDDATYTVKVSVTDGGKGLLLCDLAYGEAGAPVFTNVYTEDKEPPKPEPPKTDGDKGDKETLPTTGDASMLFAVPAIAGAAATAAGIYTSKRKRNRS